MNLLDVLRSLFPTQPSLEEFINAHDPKTPYDVEELARQYDRIYTQSRWDA